MNDPMLRPIVVRLEQTCQFSPTQWEGRTVDDRPVYIRGRNGFLSVRIGPAGGGILDAVRGREIVRLPHDSADVLSSEDMLGMLVDSLDFSALGRVGPFEE
jgi:hypothetical protein